MLRSISATVALLGALIAPAVAQDAPRGSECLAMSNAAPRATPVSLRTAAAGTGEVAITYAGHSTYYIDTPGGVRIATDRGHRAQKDAGVVVRIAEELLTLQCLFMVTYRLLLLYRR